MTETQAPIAGMWVVDSELELSPEIVDRVKDLLLTAFEDGEQIIVSDGIEFRWRPTQIDSAPISVDRLAQAIHSVGKAWYLESGEIEDHHIEVNSDQLARAILDELA